MPGHLRLIDFLASHVADDVGPVSCDARALHTIEVAFADANAALSRLLATAMSDHVPGAGLELRTELEERGLLLSAVQHPEPAIRCILARERLPFSAIHDQTTLRNLRWLLSRIEQQARDEPDFIKSVIITDAARLPPVTAIPSADETRATSTWSSPVRVLMQAKTQEGRACLPRLLPLACAEVCPLMDDADIILLDVASVDFRRSSSWSTLLRLNPYNERARIVVVADQPAPLEIKGAHIVDWDTRIVDFRRLLLNVSGKPSPTRRASPSPLEPADQKKFDLLLQEIETQVTQRAARRAERVHRLAKDINLPVEKAWATIRKAEAGFINELPSPVQLTLEDLRRDEVTTEQIALKSLNCTDDHLRRWLAVRGLPLFKDLITRAQVDYARRLLVRSDIDWNALTEELGMSKKYLKRWAREHDIDIPSLVDANTRLARIKQRLRHRQS